MKSYLLWTAFAVSTTLLVFFGGGNHIPIEIPIDNGYVEALRHESEQLRIKLADAHAENVKLKRQVQQSQRLTAKYKSEYAALQAAVPPLTEFMQALQREAVMPQGLQEIVKRHYGDAIAGRIRVIK